MSDKIEGISAETVKLVSDEELRQAFEGTNFGNANPREIVAETLLKIAGGYSPGHTAWLCCQELGLVGKNKLNMTLLRKGKRYLFWSHRRLASGEVVLRKDVEELIVALRWMAENGWAMASAEGRERMKIITKYIEGGFNV